MGPDAGNSGGTCKAMKQKVLVTGATGFIGMKLISQLCHSVEYDIVSLVRKTSDVRDLKKLNVKLAVQELKDEIDDTLMQDVSIVIHLAGQMGQYGLTYEDYYSLNCEATARLLQAADKAGVKHFIYCSTPGVLGFGKRSAKEDTPYAPRNDYEKTKMQAEIIIKEHCSTRELKYTIIRPDFVYGPGDYRRIKMYKNIKERKFILTTSGKSYLHPTFVEDVVQGFLCCLNNENAYNQIFNIAAKEDMIAHEYLQEIATAVGSRLIKINIGYTCSVFFAQIVDKLTQMFFKKEGLVSKNKIDFLAIDHSSSIEKAEYILKFSPTYSFKSGIKETIQWVKEEGGMK